MKQKGFSRRQLMTGIACLLLTSGGSGLGYFILRKRQKLRKDSFTTVLQEIKTHGYLGVEVLRIGKSYLSAHFPNGDIDTILADLSLSNESIQSQDLITLVEKVRNDLNAKIRQDLGKGSLITVEGFVITPTFAKICALSFMILE
jgi:hypothetical protein